MEPFVIDHLYSGGIITNYFCSARCKHCLYCSSPGWSKDYMTPTVGKSLLQQLKQLGCDSVHIGGGEPLLNPEALLPILAEARTARVEVEYIETNSSWFRNGTQARSILNSLLDYGVSTLLLSVSPFHAEYVPFRKVVDLQECCAQVGMNVFLWQTQFWNEMRTLDIDRTHALEEWEEHFGSDYRQRLPQRFGLTMRGRALMYYQQALLQKPFQYWLDESEPCTNLANTGHFHVDLYGRYLPSSCSGLALKCSDLGEGLDEAAYPLLTTLYNNGIAGLHAVGAQHGFSPAATYVSKCHFCMDIRRHLSTLSESNFQEIHPKPYYQQMLTDSL